MLVPRINGNHIEEIARTVAELGADKYNIIPLIPSAKLKDEPAPNCGEIEAARMAASQYNELSLHCNHCRADAIGVPGKSEFANKVYANFRSVNHEEHFSHG